MDAPPLVERPRYRFGNTIPVPDNEFSAVTYRVNVASTEKPLLQQNQHDRAEGEHLQYATPSTFDERLDTFDDWPERATGQTRTAMAIEGFKYTGSSDIVQCVSCGIAVGGWNSEDDIATKHMNSSPGCTFMRKRVRAQVEAVDIGIYQCQEEAHDQNINTSEQSENEQDIWKTIEENERLRKGRRCRKCNICDRDTVFLPCGRADYCHSCVEDMQLCPICKQHISRKVFVQLSCRFMNA